MFLWFFLVCFLLPNIWLPMCFIRKANNSDGRPLMDSYLSKQDLSCPPSTLDSELLRIWIAIRNSGPLKCREGSCVTWTRQVTKTLFSICRHICRLLQTCLKWFVCFRFIKIKTRATFKDFPLRWVTYCSHVTSVNNVSSFTQMLPIFFSFILHWNFPRKTYSHDTCCFWVLASGVIFLLHWWWLKAFTL